MTQIVHAATDILILHPGDVASKLLKFTDFDLDSLIGLTDNAATVNRLARIERGRRTERQQGSSSVLPGSTQSQTERNRRSEEMIVAEWVDENREPISTIEDNGWKKLVALARGRTTHVSHNSGENEWYTPAEYIHAAREVMGGIDLDPASTHEANTIVQAERFYTIADDGLTQDWYGRVWLNPPYSQPLIGRFAEKIADQYVRDSIEQACVLVNNATETEWFIHMASVANAFCFPKTRIRFWAPDKIASPLQGQAVMYFGEHYLDFTRVFRQFGGVCLVKP